MEDEYLTSVASHCGSSCAPRGVEGLMEAYVFKGIVRDFY